MSPDSQPNPTPTSPRRWRVWPWALAALVPVVVFGVMIWQQRWMSDDGFINITVVRNLLAGHGPVFNVGERIETYTSTLWLGLITLPAALGVRAEWAAVSLGLAFSVVGMATAIWASATLYRWKAAAGLGVFEGLLPLGALTYAVLPPAWDFGTSGLETGLVLGWMGVSFLLLTRLAIAETAETSETNAQPPERPAWHIYGLACLLGLGPLIRPELALMSLSLLVPLLMVVFRPARGGFDFKKLVLLGVAMGAIPVGYEIFRMGYFAALVPNTALAKEAFESRWTQGGYFFENFFGLYELLVPLSLLAVVWAGQLGRSLSHKNWLRLALYAAPTLCGVFYTVYVIKIGGGFMHGRLFLPAVFAMILPLASVPLRPADAGRLTRWQYAAVALIVVAWASVCATSLRVDPENSHGIGDERGWYVRQAKVDHPITLEEYEKMYFTSDARRLRRVGERRCPPAFTEPVAGGWANDPKCKPTTYVGKTQGTKFGGLFPRRRNYGVRQEYVDRGVALVVMRTGMGIRSLVLGPRVHVVDHVGLASPLASRMELTHRGRPGHEKGLATPWMVGRFAPGEPGEDPRVTAARHALSCGALGDLLDAVEGPISLARFASNVADAFRFHRLRIPADPFEAEQRFCATKPTTELLAGGDGGSPATWHCPRGYVLSGIDTRFDPRKKILSWVAPECRAVADQPKKLGSKGKAAPAPNFGGHGRGRTNRLRCPHDGVVVGLTGKRRRFIDQFTVICASGSTQEPKIDSVEAGNKAGDDPKGAAKHKAFGLRCPTGEVATGLHLRSGTAIDAIGLVCDSLPD